MRLKKDNRNDASGIFVDFQNAFHTIGINSIINNIIIIYRGKIDVKYGVLQCSILLPFLFLININDLHLAIKYFEVHHFTDDTSLLSFNDSVKSISKQVNHDLKNITNWLKANKISLNVDKPELLHINSPMK